MYTKGTALESSKSEMEMVKGNKNDFKQTQKNKLKGFFTATTKN